ncbi:MAG TPA: hypothetical protein VK563_16190 [Puia sp.]|nr:hypothetical protein [Puia sp.]
MKKFLLVLAVGAFAACNNASTDAKAGDSTKVDTSKVMVDTVKHDSTHVVVDSVKKDTTKKM